MILLFGAVGLRRWRLAAIAAKMSPGVSLRLVQPDVPQTEKYGRYIHSELAAAVDLSGVRRRPDPHHLAGSGDRFPLARSPGRWTRSRFSPRAGGA